MQSDTWTRPVLAKLTGSMHAQGGQAASLMEGQYLQTYKKHFTSYPNTSDIVIRSIEGALS